MKEIARVMRQLFLLFCLFTHLIDALFEIACGYGLIVRAYCKFALAWVLRNMGDRFDE